MLRPRTVNTRTPNMTFQLIKCLNDDPKNLQAETIDTLYLNGYSFGERTLEDIVFAITTDGQNLLAKMLIDEGLRKRLRINRKEAERDAVEFALRNDVFSITDKLRDDDGVILRTDLPAEKQSFNCPERVTIDGTPITLPHPKTHRTL